MTDDCAQCAIDRRAAAITIHYHPTPSHCDRPMLPVVDSNTQSPTFNQRFWWCADCHTKTPRPEMH
jgi:hypothetical protein